MIKFEDIPQLMKELNTPNLRIRDTNDNLIFTIENKSVDPTVKKLKEICNTLKSYGRIYITAATENVKAARYKNAFEWEVTFSDTPSIAAAPQTVVSSSNDKLLQDLQMQLLNLKFEHEKEKQIAELKAKYAKKDKMAFNPGYVVLIGNALGWDDAKTTSVMNMAIIAQGGTPVATGALAGTGAAQAKTNLSMKHSEEEKQEAETKANAAMLPVLKKMGEVAFSEMIILLMETVNKTDGDTVIKLLTALNSQKDVKQTVNTLLQFTQ